MFKKIVVGFDGSETSVKALQLACGLADTLKSEVHVVHTPQPHTVAFALGGMSGYGVTTTLPSRDETEAAAKKVIEDATFLAQEAGHPLAGTAIKAGEPADRIVEYAEEIGADLIVTGRRGLGALGAMVQGSTSLRVNHLAKCASLSVI